MDKFDRKLKLNFKKGCIASLFVGMGIFLFLYGYRILNPFYTDWLKLVNHMDLTQHYYGWLFFKNSDWFFPLGMFDSLSYPDKISIIYTDSIPIVAILFKFILKLFKYTGEFQYFGIYGMLCFSLQSLFGFIIARKFIKSNFVSLFYAGLMCLSFPMISTMFIHTALSSHWLLLICFTIIIYRKHFKRKSILFQTSIFALIAFLASSIHIYLIVECLIILFGYFLLCLIDNTNKENILKKFLNFLLMFLVFIGVSLATIYICGGFSSGVWFETQNIASGTFRGDFLYLFRSGKLSILKNILFDSENAQVSAFCGIGFSFLLLMFLMYILKNKSIVIKNKKISLFIFATFIIIFFLSMFPLIAFNNIVLYEFNPEKIPLIKNLTNTFRSNGRFIIINTYILMILPLLTMQKIKKLNIIILILISISVQFLDLSIFYKKYLSFFRVKHEYKSALKTPDIINTSKSGVFILSKTVFMTKDKIINSFPLADFAFRNGLKMTYFYFARDMKNRGEYFDYKTRNPLKDDIFVFMSFSEYNRYTDLLHCSNIYESRNHFFCRI